ncbi:MAG: Clp protease ClpP, partial [Parachlamydiaceae bacterium]|nr:Clp protease ClpP [Parachlamydiaceae bacterium]
MRKGRDIIVYAADLNKGGVAPISLGYDDLLPFNDQLSNLKGDKLDFILETPGGSGEVAEDIVRLVRKKYNDVTFIIPGTAKSAGTIMAMSGDDIMMEQMSSLGPIDAQLSTTQGKRFSAEAFLKGIERIKSESVDHLNKAYLPILQGISPGEIESAQNSLNFAKVLVTDWLAKYKFKNWTHHSSTGMEVTTAERNQRANEIASLLCKHEHWFSHGRSIKIEDFIAMRLKITDYSDDLDFADAIRRYHILMQMTFTHSNVYKITETIT